jgi:hypothetical protein
MAPGLPRRSDLPPAHRLPDRETWTPLATAAPMASRTVAPTARPDRARRTPTAVAAQSAPAPLRVHPGRARKARAVATEEPVTERRAAGQRAAGQPACAGPAGRTRSSAQAPRARVAPPPAVQKPAVQKSTARKPVVLTSAQAPPARKQRNGAGPAGRTRCVRRSRQNPPAPSWPAEPAALPSDAAAVAGTAGRYAAARTGDR